MSKIGTSAILAACTVQIMAWAHPVSQGVLEILIFHDKVTVKARITVEETCISNSSWLLVNENGVYRACDLERAFQKHGQYLLEHLFVFIRDCRLRGALLKIEPPQHLHQGINPNDIEREYVYYQFEFKHPSVVPRGSGSSGAKMDLSDTFLSQPLRLGTNGLKEIDYAPGIPWEVNYLVLIRNSGEEASDLFLLTCHKSVSFMNPERGQPEHSDADQAPVRVNMSRIFLNYLSHGLGHILGYRSLNGWEGIGYDHLLFISALTLAFIRFFDMIKIVTAFTLAHTLTLTLSVLDIFRLPALALLNP